MEAWSKGGERIMYDDIILFTKVVKFGGFAQASRKLFGIVNLV